MGGRNVHTRLKNYWYTIYVGTFGPHNIKNTKTTHTHTIACVGHRRGLCYHICYA